MHISIKGKKIVPKDPFTKELLERHDIKLYLVSRENAMAANIRAVIGFSDIRRKNIFLIDEDIEMVSETSVKCVIIHEMAHIVLQTSDEDICDKGAVLAYGKEAVELARHETDYVISNRMKVEKQQMHEDK